MCLREFRIKDWRTEPYTPQQNGKMEKWWDTLEKGVKNRQQIADFVKYYNGCWTHNGIYEQTGVRMTPLNFWRTQRTWVEVPESELGIDYYQPGELRNEP
jgi:transposase InsO family protein